MKKPLILLIILVVLAVVVGLWTVAHNRNTQPGKYDALAACLGQKGAKFYGAFWCPHCQNQKAMFGSSKSLLPYIECSTPDGKRQNQTCKDKKIDGYPTWEFADGSRLTGEIPLATLASKTGCSLPQ